MKRGRAPLPVSTNLWKGLLHHGFANNPQELGTLARRYLYLGDARLLLSELRMRPQIPTQTSKTVEPPESRLKSGSGA